MNVYSFRNRKVGFYNLPIYQPLAKDEMAKSYSRLCLLETAEARKNHLDECELYLLGEFDDVTGEFNLLAKPEFVCDFAQYFKE